MLGQNWTKGGIKLYKIIRDGGKVMHRRGPLPLSSQAPPNWLVMGTPAGSNKKTQQQCTGGTPPFKLTPFALCCSHRGRGMAVQLSELLCKNLDWNEKEAMRKKGTPARTHPTPSTVCSLPEILKSPLGSGSLESPELIILLIGRHRCAVP